MYSWLTPHQISKYLPEIEREKVSLVARSKNGFLTEYFKHNQKIKNKIVPNTKISWNKKRELFIRRTLAAYRKNPTRRRKLSLIAWAYNPDKKL